MKHDPSCWLAATVGAELQTQAAAFSLFPFLFMLESVEAPG